MCPSGFHQDDLGMDACKLVAEGYFSSRPQAVFGVACPAGSHGRGADEVVDGLLGRVGCNLCPKGYFQSSEGEYTCEKCSPGQYARGVGWV